MSELSQKVHDSIERLKAFCPDEGYYLAFSGGKDSVVCKALLEMSGCKYDATYRVTSVDPPELVRFIKEKHPDVVREIPRDDDGKPITMWNLIPKKLMPPTRIIRYCCSSLKETGGDGRMTVTGVRWAESPRRKQNQGLVTFFKKNKQLINELAENEDFTLTKLGGVVLTNDNEDSRRMVENCYRRNKVTVNPIIDWTDNDVWDFIKSESIPYCSLYDEGFTRLGCINCPMARRKMRETELARYPKYMNAYLKAYDKMLQNRRDRNMETSWETPIDVHNWSIENGVMVGQYNIFDDEDL